MIAREPIRYPKCSPDHWRELIFAMNARPDRVLVRAESLEDVCQCHLQRLNLPMPDLQAVRQGTKYISVNRMALWGFLDEHGAVCDRSA